MKLTWIDWSIVLGFVGALTALAAYTKRYTKSVSDFLAADRCAGRYLLTMSEGMAGLGAASVIANFEKFYKAGFAASWWGLMLAPIG
ncbi:MAG TPA: sodium:solute symporter, partial [Phycisphaerales bacterium]|nr:sodium:solute symporter [Phycisphaerales bacterium]